MTPHKHAAEIKAWADGALIQFRMAHHAPWEDCLVNNPSWNCYTQFRVKPQVVRYRRCIYKDASGTPFTTALNDGFGQSSRDWEKAPQFVRWIDTGWQEVEI